MPGDVKLSVSKIVYKYIHCVYNFPMQHSRSQMVFETFL